MIRSPSLLAFSFAAALCAALGCHADEAPADDDTSGSSSGETSSSSSSGDAGGSTSSSGALDAAADHTPALPALPRYHVPVDDAPDLAPWSYYAVTGTADAEIRRGTLKVEYTFPDQLNGEPMLVHLEGPYQAGSRRVAVSAAPYGSGECTLDAEVWSCREVFDALPIDRAKARAAMEAAGLERSEIEQRLQVTDRFSVDPIGVYEFSAESVVVRED